MSQWAGTQKVIHGGLTPAGRTLKFSSEPPVSLTKKSSFSCIHQGRVVRCWVKATQD